MNRLQNIARTYGIIQDVINELQLDLSGMNVLTELASGNFIVTPVIAVMANADNVYAVCKDSRYGSVPELKSYLTEVFGKLNLDTSKIHFTVNKNDVAGEINLVTNSGFVRPVSDDFISRLPRDAAISLMFEAWEFRPEDINVKSCISHNIPVLAVNENDSRLDIFRYVGLVALKLLLENDLEIYKCRFALVSSGEYEKNIVKVLEANGAAVDCFDPENVSGIDEKRYDALIVAEQVSQKCIFSKKDSPFLEKPEYQGMLLVHIAGELDYEWIKKCGISKYPEREVSANHMTVSTDHVGVRPVISLNAAGLKVGQRLVEGMRRFGEAKKACEYALEDGVVQNFDIKGDWIQ